MRPKSSGVTSRSSIWSRNSSSFSKSSSGSGGSRRSPVSGSTSGSSISTSTSTFDIASSLQQVAAFDVLVRDRDDPIVGGDRDLGLGRADQLAGEAPAA